MIFAAFAIPAALQRKILLYGVLGALRKSLTRRKRCQLRGTFRVSNPQSIPWFFGLLRSPQLLMIFAAFAIPAALQRKILLYGVLGAIVLRTLFILQYWFLHLGLLRT
jgi:hypothetical protein